MSTLSFGKGNAKLGKAISTFSLPAGKTCPGALECHSWVTLSKGKKRIKDGKKTIFRCFAASQEVLYENTYQSRRRNRRLLRVKDKSSLILASLPKKAKYVRVHVSGDFYSQAYFDSWVQVALERPEVTFYAYTKSLLYWVERIASPLGALSLNGIPPNLVLTASFGGRYDALIERHNLRSAKVVFSEEEAYTLGLELDHDDSHAMKPGPSFALLIHGTQPKGSKAAKAKAALNGKGAYPKRLPKAKWGETLIPPEIVKRAFQR